MTREKPTVSCKTCGEPTTFTGTKQCNGCHEVEMRLGEYLRNGGVNARAFVTRELAKEAVSTDEVRANAAYSRMLSERGNGDLYLEVGRIVPVMIEEFSAAREQMIEAAIAIERDKSLTTEEALAAIRKIGK